MRSLFLRIFFWFWIAMLAVGFVLVVTSPFFTQSRPRVERWQQGAESWAQERLNRAAEMITASGAEVAPFEGSRGHGRRGGSELFIFDSNGVEVRNREAPEVVVDFARRVAKGGEEDTHRRGGMHMVGRPVIDPMGRHLVVVSALRRPPKLVDLLEPEALWWRLAVLALIVGVVSFSLARYLSGPVGALRGATQKLRDGDLSARVGRPVDRRRDEIGDLARDFDGMAERLEGLVGSQRRLLRDVSHELRSPLARLTVALQIARDRSGSGATEPLDRIEREAARLDELIGQLLLLERLEARDPDAEAVRFDLAGLLNGVVDDASFEASAAGTEVAFESNRPCHMEGWPDLVRSALDNVIRNAIRHAPDGTSIDVTMCPEGTDSVVTVRDRGPGVPEDHLESLFEPFTRVAEARDRKTGGSGLGLAIARRAIEVHHGSVGARNHTEGGLEVVIRLPVGPDADGGRQSL